jgi:hypothetical protein
MKKQVLKWNSSDFLKFTYIGILINIYTQTHKNYQVIGRNMLKYY